MRARGIDMATKGLAVASVVLGIALLAGTGCSGDSADSRASGADGAVYVESIEPSSGTIGTEVLIRGHGFTRRGNDIGFSTGELHQGREMVFLDSVPSPDGETLTFELPDTLGACAMSQLRPNEDCEDVGFDMPVGELMLSVINRNGNSNSVGFTRELSEIEKAQTKTAESPILRELLQTLDEVVRASYEPATGLYNVNYSYGLRESDDGEVYIQIGVHGFDVDDLEIPSEIEGYEVRMDGVTPSPQ